MKKTLFIFFLFSLSFLNAQEKNLDKVFRVISQLPNFQADRALISRLNGGLTNDNYKVSFGATSYFVRCNCGQNQLLESSLEREWICASLAAEAELAPKIIYYEPAEGVMLSNFICSQAEEINLRDSLTMQKFCDLVRSLHNLDVKFPSQFNPIDSIHNYVKNAHAIGAPLPPIICDLMLPWIVQLEQTINLQTKKVPCHLDLHHGNVLDDGNQMWLIDWEYAAMGDPLFDLATAASVENFSEKEMLQLLQSYFNGKTPTKKEVDYFHFMRILADARWTIWFYLQAKISPLDIPFAKDGDVFLERCLNELNVLSLSLN